MFDFTNTDKTMTNLTNGGAFLVSGNPPNVMTISWGMTGVMWKEEVMLVPVRESRYTKGKIDESGEFTVSVPFESPLPPSGGVPPFDKGGGKSESSVDFAAALKICGTKSGRDTDKFADCGLSAVRAREADTFVVGGCDAYYECKVLVELSLTPENTKNIPESIYANNDYHTLYIARVVAKY